VNAKSMTTLVEMNGQHVRGATGLRRVSMKHVFFLCADDQVSSLPTRLTHYSIRLYSSCNNNN
jgi:hypothetical protein